MLKIRVAWDKPIDLSPLTNEIHEVFGEKLLDAAIDSTPVDTGRTIQSWYQTRVDEHTTEINNGSYVGGYQVLSLLHEGTKPHVVGMFYWKAAGAFIRAGLRVRIDPDKIAVRAVKSSRGLPDAYNPKTRWEAVQFYSYHEDLTNAIDKGVGLAVRRMDQG